MAASTQPARVAVVEDQRAFAEALTLALEFTDDLRVVCTASNAQTGLEAIGKTRPDLVVIDYRLRGTESGIDLATLIRASEQLDPKKRPTPIVILTGYAAPKVIREAGRVEALSVLSKDSPISEIVSGLRGALAGKSCRTQTVDDPYGLSEAELEVLELLTLGLNAAEIAHRLCLSIHAIRARIKTTLRKMDVTSQLEAVARGASLGLAVPPQDGPRPESTPVSSPRHGISRLVAHA